MDVTELLACRNEVAPFTGAWIEMDVTELLACRNEVAPFTGAWIEIYGKTRKTTKKRMSHPSRVRGLKFP